MKNKIHICIEKAKYNYSAYIKEVDGIISTGGTIDETKRMMREALQLFIEECIKDGYELPEVLKTDYEIIYVIVP